MMYDKKIHGRNNALMIDIIHIVTGILIVLLAVLTFLNPEKHLILFPIVFFLASVLNIMNGIYKIKQSNREKKKKLNGFGHIVIAVLLIVMTVVSGISIWG